MKIINQGAMQETGSRCPHEVWYTGLDPQKSTIVLGWAPGTRGQHGPLAVWVSPEDTCRGAGEPDPGLPDGWGRPPPEVTCHCPSSALSTCFRRGVSWWARRNESQKQAPGGSLGAPLAAGVWAASACPLPCTGGTVEPGAPVQATGCFLFQSKACQEWPVSHHGQPRHCADLAL